MTQIGRNLSVQDSILMQQDTDSNIKMIQINRSCEYSIERKISRNDSIIELHRKFGNQWRKIGAHFSETQDFNQQSHDSAMKNIFYTLLRKALRKINRFIKLANKLNKSKNKTLKLSFVFKLTNLAESQRHGENPQTHYTNLLYNLLKIKDFIPQKPKNFKNTSASQYFKEISNQYLQKLAQELRSVEVFFLEHKLTKRGNSKKRFSQKKFAQTFIVQKQVSKKQPINPIKPQQISKEKPYNSFQLFYQNLTSNQIVNEQVQLFDFQYSLWSRDKSQTILLSTEIFDSLLFK